MKKLLFLVLLSGILIFASGCIREKSDKTIILDEVMPLIKKALETNDGNLYLEQISADAPERSKFTEEAILLNKKEIPKTEIKIGELQFYKENNREFAKLFVIEKQTNKEQSCDYIFRKERVSWKLFSINCEN